MPTTTPWTSRLQLALNVDDIDQAVEFYSTLFDTKPAKLRPGYANFAIDQPPLKLILFENPGRGGSLNHLGVEVPTTDDVDVVQRRLAERGLASVDERDMTCCYAKQDKFWVEGAPDNARWEFYAVLADDQAELEDQTTRTAGSSCCTDEAESSGCCG
jgi:predicted enzyme related to lactoylglutathione lyase